MVKFLREDFLLNTDVAKKLYFEYAKDKPIIDYHCHLIPKEIAENKKFRNITELFLGGDCELETMIMALKFITKALEDGAKGVHD